MARRRISQREAWTLARRVTELETVIRRQRHAWSQEFVGGVNICTVTYGSPNDVAPLAVRTARKLGHAVVVVGDDSGVLRFMALPLAKAEGA